jgi:3-phenylpropionate/trans-cinnamate dioxygenase ferredoxin subunit
MAGWHDIASLDDLRRDGRVVARVGGREIGVVLDPDGHPHAVRNRCPHHGAPLCLGSVRDRLEGAPGSYAPPRTRILRCPWHGWEFDLDTGGCQDDPSMRVRVYPVRVSGDGRVLVQA